MADIRLRKLANLLVEYSTGVKKGEKVYISAEAVAIPFIAEVARAAIKKGAYVEYNVNIPEIAETLLKEGSEEQLLKPSDSFKLVVDNADVFITAWGTENTRVNSNIDPKKIQTKVRGNSELRKIFSEKMGKGEIRWCGTQFPTHADAQEANMSLREYEDFVYGAGLLDAEDPIAQWKEISAQQQRWVEYLNGKKELHILAPNTDIKVKIGGRKWINCDGRVNFPDGEIFTSPVEDGIDGYITFSFPGIYAGKEIENIYLEVEKGKVVKATASKGEDLLHALLDTDQGSRYFGEVAIGTNYGIQKFTKNMLFDEKIGGTIHMAIGDSMPEAGGQNRSAIHWDMLCDMRSGGKIYADGELFYENGKFLEEVLKK
ncbi:Leucyl aminopeptidase (aminopeptidase T) [Anaerobranca californiensis DSM 14826]|uniref:Leucyl aminopeptidase (Aminopeptidase T) n=1 Tax=Anaerobranca californiensis DSM 14826 TaxID=1120989 RepID=A0A1M6L9X3_9FIRM|nr:aminopeptidase [Anaerobranca californiensis]SHJ68011.1 Leucyl aminopeptidase (aminopeptidase T) [Anaerobranca californiensis DSM 14826]